MKLWFQVLDYLSFSYNLINWYIYLTIMKHRYVTIYLTALDVSISIKLSSNISLSITSSMMISLSYTDIINDHLMIYSSLSWNHPYYGSISYILSPRIRIISQESSFMIINRPSCPYFSSISYILSPSRRKITIYDHYDPL